ncbi:hypothetical protein CRE_07610 [Caenorhabditis remanei]|uniref:Uncharacterized protein n=1 Tax=Caenorhabditis remanei TaxID=31234 RepID=E3MP82_CAERE|nr:hypothetical protein CRE_07610 [Caenorhabditis remanei]
MPTSFLKALSDSQAIVLGAEDPRLAQLMEENEKLKKEKEEKDKKLIRPNEEMKLPARADMLEKKWRNWRKKKEIKDDLKVAMEKKKTAQDGVKAMGKMENQEIKKLEADLKKKTEEKNEMEAKMKEKLEEQSE